MAESQLNDIDRLSEAARNLQKSLECTICLELMTEPTKTRCGHSFCKSCIGGVLKKKNTSCPLCKKSLNRRSISKDDHLQTCIEKFKTLIIAIETDTCIDILWHSKQPRDTKESCASPDTRQSNRDSNKEKPSKKERSIRQLNQSANSQTEKPSTCHRTMIDNPRYDLDVPDKKPETLSSLSLARASLSDENDNASHRKDIEVRTWLHSFPEKLNTDDWIAESEIPPVEDKASLIDPSDDGKSDELFEVYHGVDASRRPSRDKEKSMDCPERIDEDDDASSQVNKGARQIGEVIEIDSAASELKYNMSHARIRAKESREKNSRSKSEAANQGSALTLTTTHGQIRHTAASAPPSTSAEQSTANWSRVIEFGKEMKRAKKRKIKKLNVSTEKNKKPLRIVEDIKLSPRSRYNAAKIAAGHDEEMTVSNRLKSNTRKQDVIEKNLDLSDAITLSETNTSELFETVTESSKSTYPTMNTSYVTLEEGRKIHIKYLNNNQISNIIGLETIAVDPKNQRCEENAADYCDLSLSQKRLSVLTPEKLNDSAPEREITCDVSQISADNFESSSCQSTKKWTPESRKTGNVQGTSSEAASSQLQPSPSKGRLSLRRKGIGDNKSTDSPPSSQVSLSYRISIGKHEEDSGDRKSVNSPGPKDRQDCEPFDRLRVVRRDLNFKIIQEDQQRTDPETAPASALKSVIEVEDNDGNVSGIVRQDGKLGRSFTGKSTVTKKTVSTKSRDIENQEHQPVVKFTQQSSLIRRRSSQSFHIEYFSLGTTKRELSMPAGVSVTPVYNMQQSGSPVNRSEMHITTFPNPWTDSQNSNITVVESICFAKNSNQAVSNKLPAASPICKVLATSTPKKDIDSHLNRKSATIVRSSTDANQRSAKLVKSVAEEGARSPKISRADKSAIHGTISHTRPGTSKSIKLLSPDKDSQLKFLEIDSPMSEREELRRASSIKSGIKGNNFSELKSSRLEASTLSKSQEPLIEKRCKKRKRIRCAGDRELFEDGSSDENDDSRDLASDSSRSTIKLDSVLSKKARASRLDVNKKRRLSPPNDQDVQVISSDSEEQPRGKFKTSGAESESTTYVAKNVKRRSDQCAQRNTSITDTATIKCPARQDLDELQNIRRLIDDLKDNKDNATRKKLTKESEDSQNSIKSMRNPSEENRASYQSSYSSNALKMEKRKTGKSSQKSSARESDMFESSSLFNSENVDYILRQSTELNANDTSKKTGDSSNDDIINRVLQIDRSQSNPNACRSPESAPRKDITSQREKDSRGYLLQDKDSFDEIIANVEQPQSVDCIPCTEQPDHNLKRPLAKQKTSDCPAMTGESCDIMQETPIVPPSSTNDMFEYHTPRKVKKLSVADAISRNSDKENEACSEKKHGYVSDQRDRKDATANADAIDKDSRKKIVSKDNISREKGKFREERNTSIQSVGRLHVDDDETQRATAAGNESKDDNFEHDSLMNITEHQNQLQMFEEDLFGITARSQMKATRTLSQDDPSQKELRTPRKRKQNTQDKNMELEVRSADEDDVVENTPEKKMNSENNVKTIESRESTQVPFFSPISTNEQTPNTSGPCQIARPFLGSGASTPTSNLLYQSTPKIWMDAKTLKNVRRIPDKLNMHFICSGLSTAQITTVKEFATKYNASYSNQFNRDVTHVIVKTVGKENAASSTLKYLQGIAHRKWIVSYRWVEDCIRQKKLLDEVPYEATTKHNDGGINGAGPRNSRLRDKGLFKGFTFLCVEPYDNVSLSQYQDLLLANGAEVVDSFEHLAKMKGLKGILIQDVHDDKKIERWYHTAKAAPILVDWIVECIGHYKLSKLQPYIPQCISIQHLCDIGYPQDLVEDEEYVDD